MQIEQNIPLAPYTTLRIGGPARYFARATSEAEIIEAVTFARTQNLPLFILGGGSNLLVSDQGFPGLVLKVATDQYMHVVERRDPDPDLIAIEVSAGVSWESFVQFVCEQGISGVECLAGIPGTVGAAPVQNIGAYGQEVSTCLDSVFGIDLAEKRKPILFRKENCGFGYRSSIFNTSQQGRYLIALVRFSFRRSAAASLTYPDLLKHFANHPNPTPLEIAEAVRQIRRTKGMLILPGDTDPDFRSAGSFFKNPVVPAETLRQIAQTLSIDLTKIPNWPASEGQIKLPAAWLIEQAGFPKGYIQGQAAISTRHTLALVNHSGHAPCADLTALRDTITTRIQTLFGILLHQEPVFVS